MRTSNAGSSRPSFFAQAGLPARARLAGFALAMLSALVLGGASLSGCFRYDEPICAYRCGAGIDCPDGYECRSDGYCHQEGTTEACEFSDAALVVDMSVQVDQGADLASFDADSPDQ